MQGARATLLSTVNATGLEAEQLQDGCQGDRSSDGVEVDGRAWAGPGWLTAGRVLSLALLFATLACLGQFAVAGVQDLLVTAFEFVLGGDIADGAVQTDLVVMGDVIG